MKRYNPISKEKIKESLVWDDFISFLKQVSNFISKEDNKIIINNTLKFHDIYYKSEFICSQAIASSFIEEILIEGNALDFLVSNGKLSIVIYKQHLKSFKVSGKYVFVNCGDIIYKFGIK